MFVYHVAYFTIEKTFFGKRVCESGSEEKECDEDSFKRRWRVSGLEAAQNGWAQVHGWRFTLFDVQSGEFGGYRREIGSLRLIRVTTNRFQLISGFASLKA